MRTSDLGKSSSVAFSRRGRDEWRTAQSRTVRYPAGTTRRGLPRRGAR
ncbi:hypothetical protein [Kribbella shirazensis]|uniref:Uncharacterized protein n=1 Tax=Kribbella shirazensis TaxID=1105143 RepID=A0A7X6A2R8_9ACTN|nr:hypothetical protein [Kribbella shirazensis]NIK59556.1 hypothetical protein [Kribbella shirazensis]